MYVGRDAEWKITNRMTMAKTMAEEKQENEGSKSTKKKASARYPFEFVEKNHNEKSLERKFQKNTNCN